MNKKSEHIWKFYMKCFCIVLCFIFVGNGQYKVLAESEREETYLEEIQEISMTKEQFKKVNYYKVPAIQVKALTRNSYDSDYGFSLLSASEKAVYKRLEAACAAFHNSTQDAQIIDDENVAIGIELDVGELSKDRIADVVVGFIYDHPQYFWTKGYSYWVGTESNDVRMIVLECDENYLVGESRYELWTKIDQNIETYLDEIIGVKDDYGKELILHDLLAKHLSYAYSSSGTAETTKWAHNIEGAFSGQYNKVVCEGYAKAFQLLLNAAGIENIYIVGNGKVGTSWQGHAWNQVKIENEWYLVDLTWNDGTVISRKYFNLDQKAFSINHVAYNQDSHQVARWCYQLENANGQTYSYQQQGEYSEDIEKYCLTYQVPEQFDFVVYNQGVEVPSGSKVEAGTKLDFVLTPKDKNILFDGILTLGKKTWEFNEYEQSYENSFYMENQNLNLTMECTEYMPIEDILEYVVVPKTLKVKKNKTKSIEVKKPKQLKNYTITFSSNHKKIVSVTKKGKIKGKKKGKAVITIKIVDSYGNKKNFKVNITCKG